jgi:hypothetical protein
MQVRYEREPSLMDTTLHYENRVPDLRDTSEFGSAPAMLAFDDLPVVIEIIGNRTDLDGNRLLDSKHRDRDLQDVPGIEVLPRLQLARPDARDRREEITCCSHLFLPFEKFLRNPKRLLRLLWISVPHTLRRRLYHG